MSHSVNFSTQIFTILMAENDAVYVFNTNKCSFGINLNSPNPKNFANPDLLSVKKRLNEREACSITDTYLLTTKMKIII